MAAFGQAGLGAGGCNGCIRYHGVLRNGDDFLFHQHFITYAAVAAFGQAGLGAGGCNGCICYLGVTRGGNNFLFLQQFITVASAAALFIGQAGLGAGSRLSLDCYLGRVAYGRSIWIIYCFFTIELLSAQGNCDRIYLFSALRTGWIALTLDCNAICCSGERFITFLALRRNRYRSKTAIRNSPIPYGFSSFIHNMSVRFASCAKRRHRYQQHSQ